MEEINALSNIDAKNLNAAKSILAFEATRVVHGESEAQKALQAAQSAFGKREIPKEILPSSTLPRDIEIADAHIPTLNMQQDEIRKEDTLIIDVLVMADFAKSKNAAKRLIKQGAVRLNEQKVEDEFARLLMDYFIKGQCIMKSGKKHICRLTIGE
tara:strand:- start:85 stop:552 length:468 start_codon:yes stop_codon:yes gene_type:complete